MSDTSRTPITEEESYALKYAKYIADETTDFTAYRVIKQSERQQEMILGSLLKLMDYLRQLECILV